VSVACGDDTSAVGASETDTGTSSGDAPSTVTLTTTTVTSADTTEGPVDTTEGPVDTTEGPIDTTEGPASTSDGSTSTSDGSTSTSDTEASTDTGSTSDTEASTDTGSTGDTDTGSTGDTDTGPLPGGSCCAPTGLPGCSDPECSASICAAEPFCCDVAWDQVCSNFAGVFCDVCNTPDVCGNGTLDGTESCDGLDFGDETCTTLGFDGGTLSCPADCSEVDTSGCFDFGGPCCVAHASPGCSDEDCVADICGIDPFCCDLSWDGFCASQAQMLCEVCNTPGVCGNNVVDAMGELCDGFDVGAETCVTQGFDAGTLSCSGDCSAFDVSGCFDLGGDCCEPHPGPGCDDPACNTQVCGMDPFCCNASWDAICADTADTICEVCGAEPGICGNFIVDAMDEVCDGPDLQGATCQSLGFEFGFLGCAFDCGAYDTSGCADGGGDCCVAHGGIGCDDPACTDLVCAQDPFCCDVSWDGLCAQTANASCPICSGVPETCGNGAIDDPSEVCDGLDLGGESCTTQGFDAGALGCGPTCTGFDTSACVEYEGPCCSGDLTPGCFEPTCTAEVCGIEPFCCDVVWDNLCAQAAQASCTACQPGVCGNGVIELGEACDGTELAGESCTGLGYSTGDLACAPDCGSLDTSDCIGGMGYGNCLAVGEEIACTEDEVCATDGNPPVASVCWQEACIDASECAVPTSGNAMITCGDIDTNGVTECFLACNLGQTCPDGMICHLGSLCAWAAP
jgi:hypothetical protein